MFATSRDGVTWRSGKSRFVCEVPFEQPVRAKRLQGEPLARASARLLTRR
jgi:hypothetical protein